MAYRLHVDSDIDFVLEVDAFVDLVVGSTEHVGFEDESVIDRKGSFSFGRTPHRIFERFLEGAVGLFG